MKRIGIVVLSVVLLVSLILGVGGCGSSSSNNAPISPTPTSTAAPTPVTLKLATFFSAASMQVKVLFEYAAEMERCTNGLVKIDIYPGGSLFPAAQLWDGVKSGACEMAYLCQYQPAGNHPATELLGVPLPGATTSWVLSQVSNDWWEEFGDTLDEYEGTKVLWMANTTPMLIQTKGKPVYKPEDLKGMTIRAITTGAELMEALGAIPIGVPTPEMFDGIQKGNFQGALMSAEGLSSWKLAEVVDYVTMTYFFGIG